VVSFTPPVSIGQEAGHTGLPVIQNCLCEFKKFMDAAKIVSVVTSMLSASLALKQEKSSASCYQSVTPLSFFLSRMNFLVQSFET
jgi:hypothetical protein